MAAVESAVTCLRWLTLWRLTVSRLPFACVCRDQGRGIGRRLEGAGPFRPPAWPPDRDPGSAGAAGKEHRNQQHAAEQAGGAAGTGRGEGPGGRSHSGSPDPVCPRAAPAAGQARYCPASPHCLKCSPVRLCSTCELLNPALAPWRCLLTDSRRAVYPGSLGPDR